jgi:hypothetical protein
MPQHRRSGGQLLLSLYEVIIRHSCKTAEVYDVLFPFLDEGQDRGRFIQLMNRLAREGRSYEVKTKEGLWIAEIIGRQGRKYCWNLLFRPNTLFNSV